MNGQQMSLHSKKFDLCRLCFMKSESNRKITFLHIFHHQDLDKQIFESFGVKVNNKDKKPKYICECCHKLMLIWLEKKKNVAAVQAIFN